MGVIEIVVILIGMVFILCSFFVPEKLSNKDVENLAKLSEAQLKIIVDKQLAMANTVIENTVEEVVADTQSKAERLLEKESNEKIMAISEYSDTVLESINKTHNEVMFLYSMLNDKYEELTNYANQISGLRGELDSFGQEMVERLNNTREEIENKEKMTSLEEIVIPDEEQKDTVYHRDEILALYHEGKNEIEIARSLGLGIGAVRLVIGLYKGEQ